MSRFASTTAVAVSRIAACTTGKSALLIEVITSRPTPGHAKIVSTITDPESSAPIRSPRMVTTGIIALRNACLKITVRRGSPFARASVT